MFRQQYEAATIPGTSIRIPIPSIPKIVDSNILLLAISSPPEAKESWWLGGWLSVNLLVSPSSTTLFAHLLEVYGAKVRRDRLTLVKFPNYDPTPYSVTVQIPRSVES